MRMQLMNKRSLIFVGLCAGTLIALLATYENHFHNGFHFDDLHTIMENPAIRSLANVPRFFVDARLFSILPTHYSYRPLVSASLAFDYWLAGGLNPLVYHISTFIWYVVQLALMVLLFGKIMSLGRPAPQNGAIALFAAAWYGLHPANAETVNYIIQRGDLYSTLGVVAGLAVYCSWPRGRKWGLFLVPVILGGLSKQSALIFPAILFGYILLFESEPFRGSAWMKSLLRCAPSLSICAALGIFEVAMTPKTFVTGASSRIGYWMTQPSIWLHYFKSFFLPTELTADTDRQAVTSIFSGTSIIGLAFVCGLLIAIVYACRSREMRPAAFGLWWFLVAVLPTSVVPLAEVDNDHRMFFPFVGLTLAVSWAIAMFVEKKTQRMALRAGGRALITGCALCLLGVYAYGAHVRNQVWHSDESLWQDVTVKSPHNGRGLMNYGQTQMAKGNLQAAYDYFQRAAIYSPNYSILEINLGVAAGELNRDAEAEQHFRRAITLAPEESQSYFFYGRWLQRRGRVPEAISILIKAAALNPADLAPRSILMLLYVQQSDWVHLKQVADEVLSVVPRDPGALRYAELARKGRAEVPGTQSVAAAATAESHLNLSLEYYKKGRYEDCLREAQEALKLRPDYAEAYNNIAAAYQAMGRWDDAIRAAQHALKLKPDLQIARNNLAYAMSKKASFTTQKIGDLRQ
jgi:tetratricopeptide (TPR) repeat protein